MDRFAVIAYQDTDRRLHDEAAMRQSLEQSFARRADLRERRRSCLDEIKRRFASRPRRQSGVTTAAFGRS